MAGPTRREFFKAGTTAALAAGIGAVGSSCQRADIAGPEVGGASFEVNLGYPIYLRDHYRGHSAPLKKVRRYVSPKIV